MDRWIKIAAYGMLAALCVGAVAYAGTAHISAGKSKADSRISKPAAPPLNTKAILPAPTQGQTPANPSVTGAAALYKLDWYSINGGGATDASSAGYKMGLSVGQTVAGEANSASYKMGVGFWYGVGGCNCPFPGDPNGSGTINVLDVVHIVNAAFRGGPIIRDPACPVSRDDFNGNGILNVLDVAAVINHAFKGGARPVAPC